MVIGAMLVAFAALMTSMQSTSAQLGDEFLVNLYGPNEVPPLASDATGSVRLQMGDGQMTYQLQASGTEFLQAHIHFGSPAQNGPVIAFLLPLQDPPLTTVNVSGIITVDDLLGDFAGDWDAFATAFLADQLYVNIHSVDNPGGELRAQLDPRYCADLAGTNEVPTNASDGSGQAIVNASNTGIGYSLSAGNGTQEFTMAHIHQGSTTENGMVMAFLFNAGSTPATAISTTGQVGVGDLLGPALGDVLAFLHYIAVSDAYVNVHSTDFPDGEIRGQLVHCDNVDAASPPDPTPTATPTATATATATTTAAPTNTPLPTATTAPTNTPLPTATTVPPGPPDTGTGTTPGSNTATMVLLLFGLAAIAIGGVTMVTARRR
jgi:hypothetical protein